MKFLHLHLHTDHSHFDGLIKIANLIEFAKQHGLDSICVTDHGNISIAIQLYKACVENNIKPIFGVEAYLVDDKRVKVRESSHIVLLAKNLKGFQNLKILNTLSYMYFYYQPRIDFEDLKKYGEGLIVTTACIGGFASKIFQKDGNSGLKNIWKKFYDLFGNDFYLEVQCFSNDRQLAFNNACIDFSEENIDVNLVATADCHYYKKEDQNLHRVFMTIKALNKSKESEFEYPYSSFLHMKNMQEMVDDFCILHKKDMTSVKSFRCALLAPFEIEEKIEKFSLKHGIVIPKFK